MMISRARLAMMRAFAGAFAALGLVAAGPAGAQSGGGQAEASQHMVAALQDYCVATGGVARAAAAAADAAGWRRVAGVPVPRGGEARFYPAQGLSLVASLLPASGGDAATESCGVIGSGDRITVVNLIQTWLGGPAVPASRIATPTHYIMYAEENGVRRFLPETTTEAELDALEDSGRLRMIGVGDRDGQLTMMLLVPHAR